MKIVKDANGNYVGSEASLTDIANPTVALDSEDEWKRLVGVALIVFLLVRS